MAETEMPSGNEEPKSDVKNDPPPQIDDVAGRKAAFSGPAPLVNRFYLNLTPVTGRLSFVEFPSSDLGADPQFRAAVTLNISDLVSLKELLDRMLKNVRQLPVEEKDASSE